MSCHHLKLDIILPLWATSDYSPESFIHRSAERASHFFSIPSCQKGSRSSYGMLNPLQTFHQRYLLDKFSSKWNGGYTVTRERSPSRWRPDIGPRGKLKDQRWELEYAERSRGNSNNSQSKPDQRHFHLRHCKVICWDMCWALFLWSYYPQRKSSPQSTTFSIDTTETSWWKYKMWI